MKLLAILLTLSFLQISSAIYILGSNGTMMHLNTPPFTGNKNPIPPNLVSFTLPIGLNAPQIQSCVAANPFLPVCFFFSLYFKIYNPHIKKILTWTS